MPLESFPDPEGLGFGTLVEVGIDVRGRWRWLRPEDVVE